MWFTEDLNYVVHRGLELQALVLEPAEAAPERPLAHSPNRYAARALPPAHAQQLSGGFGQVAPSWLPATIA
jgi:hypothetical protein